MNSFVKKRNARRREQLIREAIKNGRNCPICGSQNEVVGVDRYGEILGYYCDCLLSSIIVQEESNGCDGTWEQISDGITDPNEVKEDFKDDFYDFDEHVVQNERPNNRRLIYCHNCKMPDGVDSRKCIEDPPYKYKCQFCGHSLRSHPQYGEGKIFDISQHKIKWIFDENGNKILL